MPLSFGLEKFGFAAESRREQLSHRRGGDQCSGQRFGRCDLIFSLKLVLKFRFCSSGSDNNNLPIWTISKHVEGRWEVMRKYGLCRVWVGVKMDANGGLNRV